MRSISLAGGARKHGLTGKALRTGEEGNELIRRSKTRDSRSRNLSVAMQFIRGSDDSTNRTGSCRAIQAFCERGLVTGRSIRGVTAACVYIAAREAKIPRKIEDVGDAFDMTTEVEVKELKRTIRLVARNLGTHHITGLRSTSRSSTLTWGSLPRYLVILGISGTRSRTTFFGRVRSLRNSRRDTILRFTEE